MKMTEKHMDLALADLGMVRHGPVRIGLADRTATARAESGVGALHWVRVAPVRDESEWVRPDAIGEAQVLADRVPMPAITGRTEWEEADPTNGKVRTVRGEAFAHIDAQPVSAEPVITSEPQVTDQWWEQLRAAHDIIQTSEGAGPGRAKFGVLARIRKMAGPDVDTSGMTWTASHGDFHWANLLATPDLVIVDWEGYGWAPTGLDAATLLTFSLAHPPTAKRVGNEFGDLLQTRQGFLVQLYMAEMVMGAIRAGFHAELEAPLKAHVGRLLN